MSASANGASSNRYTVHASGTERGWEVSIIDSRGRVMFTRPCENEGEARTFASTVRQHLYWLSEDKFREYYRLSAPA